jgi:hypothetical protein
MTIEHQHYYHYSKEILVREFSGRVALEQIIASWDYLLDNKMITPVLKGVINDLEFCEPGLNPDSFQKLMLYLKSKPELKDLNWRLYVQCQRISFFPFSLSPMSVICRLKRFQPSTQLLNG